jgi:hypothetical protein
VWEAAKSGAFTDRLAVVLGALRPALLLAPASHPLAVTAWVCVASLLVSALALRRLARRTAIFAARR